MNTTSELVVSWAPPKKRGGSLANHAISITYSPASSCNISIRSWFLIYSRIIFSSSRPTVLTQYPRAQNVRPRTMRLLLLPKLIISDALLPFKRPMTCATEYFGGIETQRWMKMIRHRMAFYDLYPLDSRPLFDRIDDNLSLRPV